MRWTFLVCAALLAVSCSNAEPSSEDADASASFAASEESTEDSTEDTAAAALTAQAAADSAAACADAAATAAAYGANAELPEEPTGLYFHDDPCTIDCSGHEAGYAWAEENGVDDPSDCGGRSQSFIEGCESYGEEQQEQQEEEATDLGYEY